MTNSFAYLQLRRWRLNGVVVALTLLDDTPLICWFVFRLRPGAFSRDWCRITIHVFLARRRRRRWEACRRADRRPCFVRRCRLRSRLWRRVGSLGSRHMCGLFWVGESTIRICHPSRPTKRFELRPLRWVIQLVHQTSYLTLFVTGGPWTGCSPFCSTALLLGR